MKIKLFFLVCAISTQAQSMQRFFNLARTTFTNARAFAYKPNIQFGFNRNFAGKMTVLSTAALGSIAMKNEGLEKESNIETVTAQNGPIKITCRKSEPRTDCEILSEKMWGSAIFNNINAIAYFNHIKEGKNINALYLRIINDDVSAGGQIYLTHDSLYSHEGNLKRSIMRRDNGEVRISCAQIKDESGKSTACSFLSKACVILNPEATCSLNTTNPTVIYKHLKSQKDIKELYTTKQTENK